MIRNWENIRLGDVAEFRNGINFSKKNIGSGIKVIGVRDFQNRIIAPLTGLDEINPQGVILEDNLLRYNDIIFVRSNGNRELIGRSLLIPKLTENITHSGFTIRLRFNSDKVIPRFYLYLFKTKLIRKILSNYGGGTNINNLNQKILSDLEISLPPLSTQQKIASILSAYDNLIANNTRRIQILEEMAQRIYKEWFVDFKYPGYENDKLVDSELGMIPEAWGVKSILEIPYIRFVKENISKYEGYKTYYATADVRGTDFVKPGIPYEYHNKPSRAQKQPIENSIWFARMKDSYKIAFFSEINKNQAENSMISSGFAGFTSEKQYFGYLYSIVSSKDFDTYKNMYATGATQVSLNNDGLSKILFSIPTQDLILKFSSIIDPIIDKCLLLKLKNNNLRQTRDLLLPKLISGKIDVSDMDIDIGET